MTGLNTLVQASYLWLLYPPSRMCERVRILELGVLCKVRNLVQTLDKDNILDDKTDDFSRSENYA